MVPYTLGDKMDEGRVIQLKNEIIKEQAEHIKELEKMIETMKTTIDELLDDHGDPYGL